MNVPEFATAGELAEYEDTDTPMRTINLSLGDLDIVSTPFQKIARK